MTRSIGIDIGKRKCVTCVMDSKGKILHEGGYDNTIAAATEFAARMKRKYGKCQAVCESTGNLWIKSFHAFESQKIPIYLANTMKLKIISDTDTKTDPIDARKLANHLRIGMIPKCYVAPPKDRDVRELLRYKMSLIKDRTAIVNQTRSLLDKHDVHIKASELYSKKATTQLASLNLNAYNDNLILQSHTKRIIDITSLINDMDNEIGRQALKNDDAKLLMSITGLDSFGALLLATEIGDIRRFKRPEQLVSWGGMCPRVFQSGDKEYHGKMKKSSNRRVNWMMIQAANVAVVHDPRMKEFYERTRKRHAGKHAIAITHVANKMIRIAWKMLQTRTAYSSHNVNLYNRKLQRHAK